MTDADGDLLVGPDAETALDPVTRLLDRQALLDLVHDYCRHVDDNDPAAAAALFTEDAVFITSRGARGTVHGRAQVQDRLALLLSTFVATSHHASGTRVRFLDDDSAVGVTYLLAWHRFAEDRPDGILWAQYHDRWARTPDGWRIAERTLRVTGEQSFPFGWQPPLPARR